MENEYWSEWFMQNVYTGNDMIWTMQNLYFASLNILYFNALRELEIKNENLKLKSHNQCP